MNSRLKLLITLCVATCLIRATTSVPINSTSTLVEATKTSEEVEAIKTSAEEIDPCDLEELASLPDCKESDEDCTTKITQTRAKRETLCEKNPHCSYCGSLIPGDLEYDDIVEPEVIPPNVQPDEIQAEVEEPPRKLIERNIIIENDNETQYYRGFIEPSSNITTIIRLTNLINNTNIINMPTTLNNTNINNIHVYQNKSSTDGGKFGLGFNEKGPCCFAVEPKACRRSTSGLKCGHKKYKTCGHQCTRKIIHPKKNQCKYSSEWPFVSCPNHNQAPYPPNYPSNYPPNYPNYYPGYYPGYYPPQQPPPMPDQFDDDDDLPLFPDDDELDKPDGDWVVGGEKCRMVSEDGLQITNCTQGGADFEHPFAKNTVDSSVKRSARHTMNYPGAPPQLQAQVPQYPYYPYQMMPQPIYIQPIPIYIPQYYQPPPPPQMNYYQPSQIQMPPADSSNEQYYYEPEIESKDLNPYQSKKSSKKHPVIMEEDDEL